MADEKRKREKPYSIKTTFEQAMKKKSKQPKD
jgi:hypothetical protein